ARKRHIDLTDEHSLAIVIQSGTHLSHDLVYTRQVFSVASYLTGVGGITWLPLRIHWVITELLIFEQHPEDVDAEAINATVQPEAQDIIHSLAHLGIAPIQICLFHIELVQVVLTGEFLGFEGS